MDLELHLEIYFLYLMRLDMTSLIDFIAKGCFNDSTKLRLTLGVFNIKITKDHRPPRSYTNYCTYKDIAPHKCMTLWHTCYRFIQYKW